MQVLVICLAGLFAYCACIVVLAPATVLDAAVARATAGRLRLADAQGTLWSGAGQLEVRDPAGTKGVGRPLSWRFEPLHVLQGRMGFRVRFANAGSSFPLRFSWSGLEINDAEFSLPAAVLGLALPGVALIGPSGDLRTRMARLAVAGNKVEADAVVTWLSAGSALTPVSPFGDYELRVQSGTAGLNASLRTLNGPLRLTGQGESRGNRPLAFRVNARVDAQAQSQLLPFLRLIAIEREAGNFELQLDQGLGRAPGVAAGQMRP